ncbi:MAG TPA: CoB--CoM heterodisulfide reductase iron-sulfur subunit A family protein [Candidatus Methylomirabilis sp.]|nr:CoB--CoM heterodisulfide reductase iron-sulfur subunit A family protein [Candidatus Methylomirabilis sp.]
MSEQSVQAHGSGNGGGEEPRIGVFICHCGGNISDVVDVQRVAEEIGRLPGVVFSTTHMFICSDPGQMLIEQKIKELNLNRVVVAACSPSLHELTFRRTLARAGLNQYLYDHTNIREQDSWVVVDKELATQKAIRLVSASVARVPHLAPLQKRVIPIHPSALVIGGGIAGLIAARDLAARGIAVTLIESSPFLGGRVPRLAGLFPTGRQARELLRPVMDAVLNNPKITIHTNAEMMQSTGFIGDFRTTVRLHPRGVEPVVRNVQAAIDACPETTDDEFNFGLTKRKAIYLPYAGCHPSLPAIDWSACTKCGKCLEAVGGRGINLAEEPRQIEIRSGVILIAVGLDLYRPRTGEYGFGQFREVITLAQLNRLLDPEGPTGGKLVQNGKPIRNIGFMHCVGSMQQKGIHPPTPNGKLNDYCSRVCCTACLHAETELKTRYPDLHVFDFHEDIRTYGRWHEDYYSRASEQGVAFVRFNPLRPPRVERDPRGQAPLVVRTVDRLTFGEEIEVPLDMLVLATGLVAGEMTRLVDLLRCSVGPDRFLLEVHPKLRPVELAVFGLFLAGSVQGPMDTVESSAGAAAAAAKASVLISQGSIELDPFIARVTEELCSGCRICLTVCPYDAIARDEAKRVATINESVCTGCGTCVATCPCNAITQLGFTDQEVKSEVLALLGKQLAAVAA